MLLTVLHHIAYSTTPPQEPCWHRLLCAFIVLWSTVERRQALHLDDSSLMQYRHQTNKIQSPTKSTHYLSICYCLYIFTKDFDDSCMMCIWELKLRQVRNVYNLLKLLAFFSLTVNCLPPHWKSLSPRSCPDSEDSSQSTALVGIILALVGRLPDTVKQHKSSYIILRGKYIWRLEPTTYAQPLLYVVLPCPFSLTIPIALIYLFRGVGEAGSRVGPLSVWHSGVFPVLQCLMRVMYYIFGLNVGLLCQSCVLEIISPVSTFTSTFWHALIGRFC